MGEPDFDLQAFLSNVALFAGLPDDDRAALASACELVTVAPGKVVFREGDRGDRMYVVAHGQVLIQRDAEGGTPFTLVSLGPKQFFGEMALFEDDVLRSATARAGDKPTLLVTLERTTFGALVTRHIELALHLISCQNRRLRELNERVVDIDRRARRYAPSLAETVEEEYPHPIALVHQEWDAACEPGTKLRRLLELVEVVLLYQNALCRGLYLVSGATDPEIDGELVAGQKGATLGQLQRQLRLMSSFLVRTPNQPGLAVEIHDWLHKKKIGGKHVSAALGELTLLRNQLKHGSEGALDDDACARLVGAHQGTLTGLVESIDFLRRYPPVNVQSMSYGDGVFRYGLQVCRGAFRTFRSEPFEHKEPLETQRLYVLDRKTAHAIPLFPWATLQRCEVCGDRDFFLAQRWSADRLDSIEFGRGHRHTLRDPGPGVQKLADALAERARKATPP